MFSEHLHDAPCYCGIFDFTFKTFNNFAGHETAISIEIFQFVAMKVADEGGRTRTSSRRTPRSGILCRRQGA